jgi:AcrR family transcriptional regulator
MPEVLDAAVEVFSVKGYENASMEEIGEMLGLLKGSIYYYTESKESLLFAVIQSVHQEMMANLEQARARDGDVLSRIRAFVEDNLVLTIDRLKHASVFQREFRHLSDPHRAEINKERRQYERFFEELLTEAQQAGIVRSDVDAKLLAIAGLTMGSAIPTWYRPAGRLGKSEVVENYTRLLLGAYQAPAPAA